MPISDDHDLQSAARPPAILSGMDRKTYEALFHHPSSHNVKWHDAVHMFQALGAVTEKPNHEYAMEIGGQRHIVRRPHAKDLTADEIHDFRQFLVAAITPDDETVLPDVPALDLLIVMDHHEARIFAVELPAHGTSHMSIRPYDPHHYLHHLKHKDQPRERGQRAHEDATFYERIAAAIIDARHIFIIGHGTGKSDAADHLVAFLATHHNETAHKIRGVRMADFAHMTEPQLLAMARAALAEFAVPGAPDCTVPSDG